MGVAEMNREVRKQGQLLEGRPESEEFPFHAEESAQRPAAEIFVEGRKEELDNLLRFRRESRLL
jgi:hypothetical protein